MKISPAHHFIGIGGVGMSAIAQILHERGGRVSGSDQAASATSERLAGLGIRVHVGHRAENVEGAEVVVVSTAVGETNPELAYARAHGLPVRHRSELLADLMAGHRTVAVAGTHGKTTTTGMVASILLGAELDPTVLVGGHLPSIGGTARTGHGPFLVAEADESDKSISRLTAEIAILTNLEGDHLEHYSGLDEIYEVMVGFLNRLPEGASVVACIDDPGVRAVLPRLTGRVQTYGFSEDAMHRLEGEVLEGTGASFALAGVPYRVQVPGRHNVLNAAAAIVASGLLGLAPDAIRPGLEAFCGVGRRFQTKGTAHGVTVVDDYAHHPSEIRATLQAASLMGRRTWVIFQPHRYTRTAALFEDFAKAFEGAHGVAVMDVYSAGEAPNGATSDKLVERMQAESLPAGVRHCPDHAAVVAAMAPLLEPGDLVLLMGAGNVYQVADSLLSALSARENSLVPPVSHT
ncbi:UDP-N-acetylmuramate--L-alanine ligase [bacterium]|nr:UDP-N-acetylmuramate--L-alanine ligase [bacterium]